MLSRRRRRDPLPWEELAERLSDVPGVAFPAPGVVEWQDGPAVSTLRDRVGEATGWDIEWRRLLSDRALVVALLRFYGSKGRHWRTGDERGRDAFEALLDVDDPGRCDYPIVAWMADAVLAAPPPPGEPRADVLSDHIRALGYERLWAQAFLAAP